MFEFPEFFILQQHNVDLLDSHSVSFILNYMARVRQEWGLVDECATQLPPGLKGTNSEFQGGC